MADTEFEEFRNTFKNLTQHNKITAPFYSLVHDVVIDEESPTSPKSNLETDCDFTDKTRFSLSVSKQKKTLQSPPILSCFEERRKRKLPEIPKNKKTTVISVYNTPHHLHKEMSLADELGSSNCGPSSMLILKSGHLWDIDSPDSERLMTDPDSGHSTAHSPTGTDGLKSLSPIMGISTSSTECGAVYNNVKILEATHRGLHKFVPRHNDEIDVEIGDPIYVQKEADDLWCEGVNLRTGRVGIFPSAYAVDCDYSDWDSSSEHGRRERYVLNYLGSVETLAHKGTSVVCQAVRKIMNNSENSLESKPCILEVSDQGLRMVDRRKNEIGPCIDYFYSLKNVSFCAFHPQDHRYLGFITKHPTLQRFACHVFQGTNSTRPVAEAVGRAFQRFYQQFIETAYPVEDIYIE